MARERNRPRLQPFRIHCALCGKEAIRLYPSRGAVREKLSGKRYCSTAHAKRGWALDQQQRRQESKESYLCLGPDCWEVIEPRPGPGRPADYCKQECREAARRERDRPVAGAVARARVALEEAQRQAFEGESIETRHRAEGEKWLAGFDAAIAEVQAKGQELGGHGYDRALEIREWWLHSLQVNAAELAALRQKVADAQEELHRAEERAARRARQARERRARNAAARDLKRALADPEYRAWLRQQGASPA